MNQEVPIAIDSAQRPVADTAFRVIVAISICHLLNDMMQSLLPAIYPALKQDLGLTFGQIGLITFVYQVTGSVLQPIVGSYSDRRAVPLALPGGPLFSLAGLAVLSIAHNFWIVLAGAVLLGFGSAVFHPEASRVARMAAGRRHGLSQSIFQVGGNFGSALGPLAAAVVVVRWGQTSLIFFSLLALLASAILWNVVAWCRHQAPVRSPARAEAPHPLGKMPRHARQGIAILVALIFSKYVYLAGFASFYTFYLIEQFGLSVRDAQLYLFVFMASAALGTIAGGPLGDRFGRRYVIWFSILGMLPFTLILPYVGLFWIGPVSVMIGLIMSSAFPAILVYAQELVPGRVGMISGLFYGLSFGVAAISAAALGWAADVIGIVEVYRIIAFLPAIGLLAAFLPRAEAEAEA
jgi:MFS transporter, FSR family, fosmidomycin resistance protein